MNPKITVITPTYNRAHTLERVYESLKNQTFKDFIWLIMDDGSTDNTKELIEKFKAENQIGIQYFKHENSKKFYTVFKAVEKVETPFFTVLDSDDEYPLNALRVLYEEAVKLNPTEFISVLGHSQTAKGKLVGSLFPQNFTEGSILEMRERLKIRGDKHALFITKPYKEYLKKFDYEFYKGKYAPQRIFFQIYDADGMKTRFINESVRIYHEDESDKNSMSNDRIQFSSYLGLRDGHLSFINSYNIQLFKYPAALIRNLIGYQFYALTNGWDLIEINQNLKHFKFLSLMAFPFSYIYYKLKFFGG
jgi:glycosyltransferase involved in cell wall biosynthesis